MYKTPWTDLKRSDSYVSACNPIQLVYIYTRFTQWDFFGVNWDKNWNV